MMEDDDSRLQPATDGARPFDVAARGSASGAPSLLDDVNGWILQVVGMQDTAVARRARHVATLRASRGGKTHVGHNARRDLAHPRLKSVLLEDDHRSILSYIATGEEELARLSVSVLDKMLALESLRVDLMRCEEALDKRAAEEAEYELAKIYPEARAVVGRLAALGIREGHWSTLTDATIRRVAHLIMAATDAAGVGSPDDPQIDPEQKAEITAKRRRR